MYKRQVPGGPEELWVSGGDFYFSRVTRWVGDDDKHDTVLLSLIHIDNYPAIPKIPETNGFFNVPTEEAVKTFQSIFGLTQDGIVGKSTWYKIKSIYTGVKGLAELYSEGVTPEEAQRAFAEVLREGRCV